jgi:hypothetical protein
VFVQHQDDQTPLGWAIGQLGKKDADHTLCSVCNKLEICPNLSKKVVIQKKNYLKKICSHILPNPHMVYHHIWLQHEKTGKKNPR